jgi:hypothetical protein
VSARLNLLSRKWTNSTSNLYNGLRTKHFTESPEFGPEIASLLSDVDLSTMQLPAIFGKFFRLAAICASAVLCAFPAAAATLERLEPAKMMELSTEIVRGKVLYCTASYRPPVVWTNCEVEVLERLKGQGGARVMVSVPGGTSSGIRQTYSGAPVLERGADYLLFLWQGKSSLKQIVGLSQGLLTIVKDEKGNLVAFRNKIEERMVDARGVEVEDKALRIRLTEMRQQLGAPTQTGAQKP